MPSHGGVFEQMPDRAQSEVVGAALLLGLVVVIVVIAGVAALDAATATADTPRANVAGEVQTDGITLNHRGGEPLPGADLRVSVRVNGSETGVDWTDGTLTGGDDTFDAGERWTVSQSYHPDSAVAVRLIHAPSNTVLFRTETTPQSPDPVAAEWGGKADAVDSEGEFSVGAGGDDDDGDDDADPSLRLRVDDLTDQDTDNPRYVVSYDAPSAEGTFDRVEVAFDSDGNADTTTETRSSERGSVDFPGEYGANEEYRITVDAYYDDGSGETVVEHARTVTDAADGANPSNDDLSESGSPALEPSTTITDRSDPERDTVEYRFDYEVDTNGNFQQVLLGVVNRNGDGGTAVETHERASRRNEAVSVEYGAGTDYKVTILVFDADGAVVDSKTRIDEADGDGSPGNS